MLKNNNKYKKISKSRDGDNHNSISTWSQAKLGGDHQENNNDKAQLCD